MEIFNGNLAINGYDLNRSAGLGVIGGALILVLTILAAVAVYHRYRTRNSTRRWLPSVVLSAVGLSVAASLALPALIDHYVWHDRVGLVKTYGVGNTGFSAPGEKEYTFAFERMTETGPPPYIYRCIGGDCATMGNKTVAAHCHTILWQPVWQWVPREECTVRVR